jgi:hypothetical protein
MREPTIRDAIGFTLTVIAVGLALWFILRAIFG